MTPAQIEAGYIPARTVMAIRNLRPWKAAIIQANADKLSRAMHDLTIFGSAVTTIDRADCDRANELVAKYPAWKLP